MVGGAMTLAFFINYCQKKYSMMSAVSPFGKYLRSAFFTLIIQSAVLLFVYLYETPKYLLLMGQE